MEILGGPIFSVAGAGESHGPAVTTIVFGCPAGQRVRRTDLQRYLDRRRPGQSKIVTQRNESDQVRIVSGTFKGKTLGVWFGGNEYPFLNWMNKLGYKTDGSPDGVTVLKQGFNVDPLLQKQADCISTMTYNEYWQVIDAGLTPEELVVFKYEDEGVSTLEDGIWVLEDSLKDPEMADKLARFVRASMKGWKWAEQNPDEAAEIVLENDATGAQTEKHQKRMMREIAKLTAGSNGALDPADYERTVEALMSGGSDPVITKKPEGAWTHDITDKALN